MIINKYQGKTEEEAKAKAREALGSSCVIMNVKEVRPKGMFGIFQKSTFEVTAAIEEEEFARAKAQSGISQAGRSNPAPTGNTANPAPTSTSTFNAVVNDSTGLNEAELKDAFSAINDILQPKNGEPVGLSDDDSAQPVAPAPAQPVAQPVRPVMNSKLNAYKAQSTSASKPMVPLAETAPKLVETDTPGTYSAPANFKKPAPAVTPDTEPEKPVKSRSDIEDNVRTNEPSNYSIVKMLYNQLLDNEVQEKYINQVLDDMDKILATSHSLDNLLSSVYQKMVLKLGRPKTITIEGRRPKIVFFIGPTGVGKTTTIAKLASKYKVEEGKKVGLITTDTYRMAAADQLRTYANILSAPMSMVYSAEELNDAIKSQIRNYDDLDLILVDTLGFSHNNAAQKEDLHNLLDSLDEAYDKEVYLVLSATTKYRDLIDITDTYSEFTGYSIIFTKLDETACYGNIYNIKQRTGAQLSYITNGQNVPDDIDAIDIQKLVKQLLGGS